jgi:hypothetical protein
MGSLSRGSPVPPLPLLQEHHQVEFCAGFPARAKQACHPSAHLAQADGCAVVAGLLLVRATDHGIWMAAILAVNVGSGGGGVCKRP